MRSRPPVPGSTLLVAALAFGVLSCSSAGPASCRAGEQQAIADSLSFGSARPDGIVTAEEWRAFVDKEVTPRFPQGLTSWDASGQWLSASGLLQHEHSFVLYLVHADTQQSEQAVREIMDIYRRVFHQEAVLRVRTTVCMSL